LKSLSAEHLDALTELDLAALTAVAGDLSILDNGLLPNAVVEALLLQLDGAVGGEIRVEGNGP
jgi:hypothetical protein